MDGGKMTMQMQRWTGRESRLLREALRQSVRGFSDYLGVSARTISKWEQLGSARVPRPDFQGMLDTVLTRASDEQRARFEAALDQAKAGTAGGEYPTNRRQFLSSAAVTPFLSGADHAPVPMGLVRSAGVASWASAIHEAVVSPGDVMRRVSQRHTDPAPGSATSLTLLADRVVALSLASKHSQLSNHLPDAIGQAEWAALHAVDSEHQSTLGAVSDMYAVAAWSLIKADDCLGAWIAAQRAITAAEQSEDLLRLTAATRCSAEVLMRAGQLEDAGRVAFLATVHLDASSPATKAPAASCLRGAAFLSAAAAAARRGDSREAHAALEAAARFGERLGEDRADLGTVFGPTNVAIHRVAIAVELCDATSAVDLARRVDLSGLPPSLRERRARFAIDVARAHAQLGDDSDSLAALLAAEVESPDETRTHRQTHRVVRQLLARPRVTAEARALADRCAISA